MRGMMGLRTLSMSSWAMPGAAIAAVRIGTRKIAVDVVPIYCFYGASENVILGK